MFTLAPQLAACRNARGSPHMRALAFACTIILGACASALAPINAPLTAASAPRAARAPAGDDVLVLALSGGGARAASFELGVLQQLRDTPGHDGRPLSEHVALITAVSGGSILAAYYGLNGEAGLDTFRAAYLDQQWRLRGPGSPAGLVGALQGGVNRPDRGAAWLDANLYHGARIGDMHAGPRVVINATDNFNSTPFAFTSFFFDGICSDSANIRVADAVSASMAVPVAFRPVLVEAYPGRCATPEWVARVRDDRSAPELARSTARAFDNYAGTTAARQRYLYLSDGGVIDNFGLMSLQVMRAAGPVPAPLTGREAVQARRIVFVVVNSEWVRPREYQTRAGGVGTAEMIYAPLDAATDASKRAALDAFAGMLPGFERDLRAYRCGLDSRTARDLGAGDGWVCGDVSLSLEVISLRDLEEPRQTELLGTATEVSLPRERVDALIQAGRDVVTRNAVLGSLRR